MKTDSKSLLRLTAAVGLALATGISAAGELSGGQIQKLVAGKTIHAKHLIRGFEFDVYFDPDGKTALRKQGGTVSTTSYKIKGNKHCLFWKGKNRCATIQDNGDGTYTRINPRGKAVIKWTKVSSGKTL